MFAGAMDRENRTAFEAGGLFYRRILEGLAMRSEPGFTNPIAANTGVNTACDRLNLRQLRTLSIVTR